MKKRASVLIAAILLLISLLLSSAGCGGNSNTRRGPTETIVDMAGRSVVIPQNIEKVFCSNPIGTVNLYALAPEKLVGWNFIPTGINADYIESGYLEMPALGVWMGAGAVPNQEEIAKVAPDVIFCFWTCDEVGVEMADSIQTQTGIPVILMDYSITASPEVFRLLGQYLGVEERAEQLALYCERVLGALKAYAGAVPESGRKSVFISQGVGGLQTDPVGSMHVQDALDLINIENVAYMPGTAGQGMGMPSVSYEQLLLWQPDAILVSEYNMGNNVMSNIYDEIMTGRGFANLAAVQSGAVYRIPQSPFSWFGKPPSVARLLGCLLLVDTLYPEYSDIDLHAEIMEFYSLFYRLELTEGQVGEFIQGWGK